MAMGEKAWLLFFVLAALVSACSGNEGPADFGVVGQDGGWTVRSGPLSDSWALQSSEKVSDTCEAISAPGYSAAGWNRASIPSTVLGALVDDGIYPDPFFGMNLRSVPGTSYPVGSVFTDIDMPDDSPFRVPWHYRTGFSAGGGMTGQQYWLVFKGVNFKGRICINGKLLAGPDKVAGTFRHYSFNVTDFLQTAGPNGLAVSVYPPTPLDLGITWVDWNPVPADKNMGLWGGVELLATGPVMIKDTFVSSALDLPGLAKAGLTLVAELKNALPEPVKGTLRWTIEGKTIQKEIVLNPMQDATISMLPSDYPELNILNPRVWWPSNLGNQELYTADVKFIVNGSVSDNAVTRFGIRQFGSALDSADQRVFTVNGHKILIRGAGYAPDMLLRYSDERDRAEIGYVKAMNLNSIRLEGKLGNVNLLNLCDEAGILVIAGWCCCDHWERWYAWDAADRKVASESLKSQIRELRTHPSVIAWLNGSDNPPPPEIEKIYLDVLKEAQWPSDLTVSSADDQDTAVTGPSGVKMTGPYEWVPPSYWLINKDRGGAFGFNTETSPGPAVPPLDSLARMLPEASLWPVDDVWNYHAGGGEFKNINVFRAAQDARYGESSGVDEFAAKAQLMAYEGIRAMFEGYGRNKYTSTGVIQWMLNNAWPSMIWHLYDYYLKPGGGYFGARKANEPVHIQYSYDDGTVAVVNSTYKAFKGLSATAEVYNLDLAKMYSKTAVLDLESDSVAEAFTVPDIPGLSKTYLARLSLSDSSGSAVSSNLYWLSTQADVLDDEHATWYYTPVKSYADLKGLYLLPKVELEIQGRIAPSGSENEQATISLTNNSAELAFFVRAEVLRGQAGDEVAPVLYDDNYISIFPGEKASIKAVYRKSDMHGLQPWLRVGGINVPVKVTTLTE
jgi:exo-1,4-beta-D-glucosaminidase